ncbi:hypothetical protein [Arthrobacter sp. MMS18-M83]|uniref:hypothetical protein n=1 Tax=Arthrobacter sp. MMS18-M83 TaxID=2996261 RepID=UPI00227D66D0|nr:hypothetical protein [Arthrobacter sp. MMS18-M83]WAH98215.1 hypothetical protein OW521_04880 [Arthrobacter sp. MMS18-M83]
MSAELERLSALAGAIEAAEEELAAAYLTLRQVAAAILRCGEATVAEVSEASGLGRGELLELAAPPRPHRGRPGTGACAGCHRHHEASRRPGIRRTGNR